VTEACSGLPSGWVSTSALFPVTLGTVISVVCSYNPTQSDQATCSQGTVFTYSQDQVCEKGENIAIQLSSSSNSNYTPVLLTPLLSLEDCTGLPAAWNHMTTSVAGGTEHGTVLTVSCEAGYTLRGSDEVTCTREEEWSYSGAGPPVCLEGTSL